MADKRRPRDVNSLAARIVAEATGQADKIEPPESVVTKDDPGAGQ
jgi:hypothetical protein